VFLEEFPLRGLARTGTLGESFTMPGDATSLEELERIVTQLERREHRWEAYRRIAETSGIRLAPDENLAFVQLCLASAPVELSDLADRFDIPPDSLGEIADRASAEAMAVRLRNGTLTPLAAVGRLSSG
jgi:hypothetical protein